MLAVVICFVDVVAAVRTGRCAGLKRTKREPDGDFMQVCDRRDPSHSLTEASAGTPPVGTVPLRWWRE